MVTVGGVLVDGGAFEVGGFSLSSANPVIKETV